MVCIWEKLVSTFLLSLLFNPIVTYMYMYCGLLSVSETYNLPILHCILFFSWLIKWILFRLQNECKHGYTTQISKSQTGILAQRKSKRKILLGFEYRLLLARTVARVTSERAFPNSKVERDAYKLAASDRCIKLNKGGEMIGEKCPQCFQWLTRLRLLV